MFVPQVRVCVVLVNVNVYSLLILYVMGTDVEFHGLSRNRRQLLWPNSTVLQFNAGIGTPSPAKLINVNWALQANFQLPWNRSQIPLDILEANSGYTGFARKKREIDFGFEKIQKDGDYENDAKLYHFYQYVQEVLDGFGQNGTSCVLQTLCRLGAEPLHSNQDDDLLHELASFVLNPTNDAALGVTEKDEQYKYMHAFKQGEDGQDCFQLYTECTTSFVDTFTKLHEIDNY